MPSVRSSLLPETDLARINRWVQTQNNRIPPHAREEVRIEADFNDRSVTILECRPPWDPAGMGSEWTRVPVARLRYTKSRRNGLCTGRIGTPDSTDTTSPNPRPTSSPFSTRSTAIPRRSSGDERVDHLPPKHVKRA